MLRGLQFEPWVAPVRHWRNRMDVACFVGLTRRRAGRRLPRSVLEWLRAEGWIDAPGQPSTDVVDGVEVIDGRTDHLPIPVDDWSSFERLFEVPTTAISEDLPRRVPGYLAAAVRSFFAQGGRRCIIIPIEHPDDLYVRSDPVRRLEVLAQILPALAGDRAAVEPIDRSRWRGIGVLHGLDDVATVCVPDLPWLVGQVPPWVTAQEPEVIPRDTFYECAPPVVPIPEEVTAPPVTIARCDEAEYRAWADAVRTVSSFLAHHRRDVQFVAALPLPTPSSEANRDAIEALLRWELMERGDEGRGSPSDHGVASRFLQLVYPWVGWSGSQGLPENLEPPDGVMAGVLARGTLLTGAFRSVIGRELYEIDRFEPKLSRGQQEREPTTIPATGAPHEGALIKRVSLVGPAPGRFEVLSDVTTAGQSSHQLANIQRLHAVWIRALRQMGELFVFEASNAQTWASVRRQLEEVGLALFRGGALRGQNATRAFSVRCDRTTMSQRDLDAGRLVAEVQYRPAAPLELVRVSLALSENREVTVVSEAAEVAT